MSNETPAAAATTPTATPAAAASPTPAASPSPSPSPAPASTETPTATTTPSPTEAPTPAATEFKIPDAWKDKPWASKVKSQEDLYKQIDGLDQLKGKKTLTIDYANSTPEEIAAHHKSLAPADVKDYAFDKMEGVDAERMGKVAPILQKHGLTVNQAQNVAKDYAAFEQSVLADATSADGFKDQMTKSFGEKYEGAVAEVVKAHEVHLSPEDKKMFEGMPNEWLALNYRATHKLVAAHNAEVAALKKQYGVEENGDAHLNKGGNPVVVDVEKQRAEYRKQLREIDARPHTAQEKQKLLDDLQKTYATQPAGKK